VRGGGRESVEENDRDRKSRIASFARHRGRHRPDVLGRSLKKVSREGKRIDSLISRLTSEFVSRQIALRMNAQKPLSESRKM
jgi:hypothetical protein